MFEAIIIVLFAAFFVATLITGIVVAGSETFAQRHPLMNAALKGLMFYSFLYAIYIVLQLIFPTLNSFGFMFGSFIGSIGGAVFAYRALLESQNRKPQNLKPDLSENSLKTLPN